MFCPCRGRNITRLAVLLCSYLSEACSGSPVSPCCSQCKEDVISDYIVVSNIARCSISRAAVTALTYWKMVPQTQSEPAGGFKPLHFLSVVAILVLAKVRSRDFRVGTFILTRRSLYTQPLRARPDISLAHGTPASRTSASNVLLLPVKESSTLTLSTKNMAPSSAYLPPKSVSQTSTPSERFIRSEQST